LQAPGRNGHTLPPSAQHVGDKLLRHQDFGAIQSVVAQEQPSAETLFQWMQAVADSRLRDLCNERLGIAEQDLLKWTTSGKLLLQHPRRNFQSMAADLRHSSMWDFSASED
jgi:hypothetical protein